MRIYLASTGQGMSKALREETVQKYRPLYILETFFNGEAACDTALRSVSNENFLLDSGAFSYMNGAKVTLDQMDHYVNRYAEYIVSRGIRQFIEVDVDNIFGLEQVERWRKKLETAAGRQCIPVWHKGRGVEYWKQMCWEYRYVAVGGLVFHVRREEYRLIQKLVEYAYKRGVKVHGLGFTKTSELQKYRFYSVDSASWTVGAALGQQRYAFRNGVMKAHRIHQEGKKVRLDKLISHNMGEWIKFQKYMNGVRW